MKKYKKLDIVNLLLEDFGLKEYFKNLTLEESCLKFRERSSTMNLCRTHYGNLEENISKNFQCFHCLEIYSLWHWKNSDCYGSLRKNRDLTSDKDLVSFYIDIIELRKDMWFPSCRKISSLQEDLQPPGRFNPSVNFPPWVDLSPIRKNCLWYRQAPELRILVTASCYEDSRAQAVEWTET